jgi:hypothetical protein
MDNVLRPPSDGPALSAYISCTNTIFLFVAVCVAYGMVRRGHAAVLPPPLLLSAQDTGIHLLANTRTHLQTHAFIHARVYVDVAVQ